MLRRLIQPHSWEDSLEGVLYELNLSPLVAVEPDGSQAQMLIAKTLLMLPKTVRDRVLYLDRVRFIGTPGVYGQYEMSVCQPHSKPKPTHEIFLDFTAMKSMTEKNKMATIAHEIAHFILGHAVTPENPCWPKKHYVKERKADDLCEKWGFGRAYKTYEDKGRRLSGRRP